MLTLFADIIFPSRCAAVCTASVHVITCFIVHAMTTWCFAFSAIR